MRGARRELAIPLTVGGLFLAFRSRGGGPILVYVQPALRFKNVFHPVMRLAN